MQAKAAAEQQQNKQNNQEKSHNSGLTVFMALPRHYRYGQLMT
jgi:hypothetical protein